MEKVFVRYPNFRSSTRKSDPCVKLDIYKDCPKCMVSITSDRFLGDEQQKKFAGSLRKHPYVIIADTLGCNLRCWFCYSHQFWIAASAAKAGCSPTFLSADELVTQIGCKVEKLIKNRDQMDKKPFMRIRFSGGEPIFATAENLRPFSGDKPIDYKQGIDFWVEVFKKLDSLVSALKQSGKIILIDAEDWNQQREWPVFISDSNGRLNIRFDTNGIAFGHNEESKRVKANEDLAGYFVGELFGLYKNRELENIKIWIDYSFKGASPNEYYWSQKMRLPAANENNPQEYSPVGIPQNSGLQELDKNIQQKRKLDPSFRHCLDVTVEKGINHDRKNRIFIYHPEAFRWERLEKDIGKTLSPVKNDICVVYNYGGGPWGLKKVGAGLIKRYFNQGADLYLNSNAETLTVREEMSQAREAVDFMYRHNKEENYYGLIYPEEHEKTAPLIDKAPIPKRAKNKEKLNKDVFGWVLTGSPINWQIALENNIWGTHAAHKDRWDMLRSGDVLFFYVTRPVSGLVGIGSLKSKQIGKEPLWPDEKALGKVKYLYRWKFDVLFKLDDDRWAKESISLKKTNIQFFSGINPIMSRSSLENIARLIMQVWDVSVPLKEDR